MSMTAFGQKLPPTIKDAFGRTVILHGLNTAGGAKHSKDNQPWITENDVAKENTEFGFNTVRYLIFWGAIEPKKGEYDENYLAEVKKRVEWYTDRGMYVILDIHQDVYGYGVGGNGAPAWACTQTKIQNLISDKRAWWMQNLEPKVIKSYVTFFKYDKRKDLQQHYILAWKKVAEMFQDNPYVIGYDLMNEPHGGNLANTLCGKFEKKQLSAFYRRLIRGVRSVDSTRYIFIEPRSFGVNFGMKSYLPRIKDAMPDGENKLIYAPHLYLIFVDVGGNYNKKYQRKLEQWFSHRIKEAKLHKAPMLIGEFGLSPGKKDFDKYLQDIFTRANQQKASWTYWSSDPGGWGPLKGDKSPSPILHELVSVYPKATAGQLKNFTYDSKTQTFLMTYICDTTIAAPTEIAIPKSLYPNGYVRSVAGLSGWNEETDATTGALKIYADEHGQEVTVFIRPKE